MKTRIIHTKFWRDPYVRKLSKDEKLVYFYVLTNEYVNIIWCYEIDADTIAFDTGIDTTTAEKCLNRLASDAKINRFKNFIYLNNAYRYEQYIGEKNETAKAKIVYQMSDEVKDWYFNTCDTPIDTPLIGTINQKP